MVPYLTKWYHRYSEAASIKCMDNFIFKLLIITFFYITEVHVNDYKIVVYVIYLHTITYKMIRLSYLSLLTNINLYWYLRLAKIVVKNDWKIVIFRYNLFSISLIEEGGDWDRRNRLKVYQGIYFLSIRDFKSAANNFLDSISTFTSYELMDYKTFVMYTVLASMIAL